MKINQYLVKTACPPSSGTLLPDHRFGVFAKHIARAALLLPVALGATVVSCNRLFLNGHRIGRKTDKSRSQ